MGPLGSLALFASRLRVAGGASSCLRERPPTCRGEDPVTNWRKVEFGCTEVACLVSREKLTNLWGTAGRKSNHNGSSITELALLVGPHEASFAPYAAAGRATFQATRPLNLPRVAAAEPLAFRLSCRSAGALKPDAAKAWLGFWGAFACAHWAADWGSPKLDSQEREK